MRYNGILYSRKPINVLTNDEGNKDLLFDGEMFWLTDGAVLVKRLAKEEPASLADVEIAEILADEDRAELWDCNVLELTGPYWLRLAVTLWDAGSDLLEKDSPLTVTDREPFTDALSENTLGLSVCVAFWIEAEKKVETSRICDYLEYLHVTASNLAERCSQNTFEEHFLKDLTNIDTHTPA